MKHSLARHSFALFACAVLAGRALCADEPPLTDITSVSLDMHSDDTETFATFTSNVVVTGNDLKLTCDRLDVTTSRLGDKTVTVGKFDKVKYMLAKGHVHIVQGDREATCGQAEVFPREDKIILTDNPIVIDHGNSSTGAGDVITLFRGKRTVKIENPHFTLPAIKDLGFDKNEPPPAQATPPADAPHPAEKSKAETSTAPALPAPSK